MSHLGLPWQRAISVEEALIFLRSGLPVAIPTETVYGLAAPIFHPQAVRRVFEIKKRPFFDPLIVHVSSWAQAQHLSPQAPKLAWLLAQKFWPGPLTLVLPKGELVDPVITSGQETVGLRYPDHPITQKMIESIGPLAAPSANYFGKTSPTTAQHVLEEFHGQVPVVDGGMCRVGIESTIVRVVGEDTLSLLRPGVISPEEISQFLKQQSISVHWLALDSVLAPGALKYHYMPQAPLHIFFSSCPQALWEKFSRPKLLQLPEEPSYCARVLYHSLREGSKSADALFLAWSLNKQKGDWLAIWERLKKAATWIEAHSED